MLVALLMEGGIEDITLDRLLGVDVLLAPATDLPSRFSVEVGRILFRLCTALWACLAVRIQWRITAEEYGGYLR